MADRLFKPFIKKTSEALKPLVISLVENAFRNYAFKRTGMTSQIFNTEWARFRKELEKIL